MSNVKFDCGGLVCPACGGTYLRQRFVEVYDFPSTHAAVRSGHVMVDECMALSPSEICAVRMCFDCETCDPGTAYHVMDIVQNQGRTYLKWGRIGRAVTGETK